MTEALWRKAFQEEGRASTEPRMLGLENLPETVWVGQKEHVGEEPKMRSERQGSRITRGLLLKGRREPWRAWSRGPT